MGPDEDRKSKSRLPVLGDSCWNLAAGGSGNRYLDHAFLPAEALI
jgi:hypothetical protein